MGGIQITQAGGAGVVNAAGAQTAGPFSTVISGISCAAAIVGAVPTRLTWAISVPAGGKAKPEPQPNALAITFLPNLPGPYSIIAVDQAGTIYSIELLVQERVTTQRGQAITPAYVAPSQVEIPTFGESLFCDNQDGGRLKTKKTTGLIATTLSALADLVDLGKSTLKWLQASDNPTTLLKARPTDGIVDFNVLQTTFANPVGGRKNQVVNIGWNFAATGSAEVAGEGTAGLSFESFFNPTVGTEYMEAHLIYVPGVTAGGYAAGAQRRPITYIFNRLTNRIEGAITGDLYSFSRDAGGTETIILDNVAKTVQFGSLAQVQVRGGFNNAGFLYQLNAAQSSYIELLRLDSANKVVLDAGAAGAKTGGTLDVATILTANAGGTATAKSILRAYTADTSYGGLYIGVTPGTGNYVLLSNGSELILNAPAAGTAISFRIANTVGFTWNGAGLRIGDATGATEKLEVIGNTLFGGALRITVLAVSNLATGGAIGTAAATVDIFSSFDVNQTTAAQTLSLPNPTTTTTGRIAEVSNIGSTAFTMHGKTVAAGGSARFKWTGAAWSAFV